jgi:hypothetical protein
LWGLLLIAALLAMVFGRWSLGFLALGTFLLAIAPAVLASRLNVTLPVPFLLATTLFIFATVVMGEAFGFYERVWWWDLALHGASAIGFGLSGFLFVFMLFEGDRFAAPPSAMGLIAFCFGMTGGALWEIFEYLMDLSFGLNMQKTGLDDTMSDLMINTLGAATGALAGFFYLRGRKTGVLIRAIQQFVTLNRRWFAKSKDKLRRHNRD